MFKDLPQGETQYDETTAHTDHLPRFVPDHECAQGKCANTTTGCFGKCHIEAGRLPRFPVAIEADPQNKYLTLAGVTMDDLK